MPVGVNSKNIIVTQDGSQYQKADTGKVAAGVLVGNTLGGAVIRTSRVLAAIPVSFAQNDKAVFKNSNLSQAIDIAFERSGLANKGATFIDATEANSELVKEAIKKTVPKWMEKVPFIKNLHLRKKLSETGVYTKGLNALCIFKTKTLLVNKEKIGWAAFHEMGHALNNMTSGVGNMLRKLRGAGGILASLVLFTGLLKRKKVEGEKPQGAWDKATTFVKNNCGKLAFLGMTPMLLEEGLASIKGAKLAKSLLSPEQFKALNKLYGKAWLSYAGIAVGLGVATFVSSKIRDKIAEPTKIS